MTLIYDPFPNPRRPYRTPLPISDALHLRLQSLRQKLESRFRIKLGDEDLIEYLCEKALERMEDWEERTRE
jgi:hypothetical protein